MIISAVIHLVIAIWCAADFDPVTGLLATYHNRSAAHLQYFRMLASSEVLWLDGNIFSLEK
jgi:hypothetical protein